MLSRGRTYTFRFDVAGTYRYRDALNPNVTGTIKVAGPPPAVSLALSQPQIDYGDQVTLSGQVNSKKAGENVQLSYQPYGQASEIVLATVITGADGTFAYNVAPKVLTNYRAKWKTASSLVVATAVRPSISFRRLNGFVTRVFAGRSMARKQIQLQRLSQFGQWVTLKRVFLDLNSRARFEAKLPCGPNRLRIAMSVNQAAPATWARSAARSPTAAPADAARSTHQTGKRSEHERTQDSHHRSCGHAGRGRRGLRPRGGRRLGRPGGSVEPVAACHLRHASGRPDPDDE